MSMNQRIAECEEATDKVIEQVEAARSRLSVLTYNGYGILSDPSLTLSDLRQAAAALDRALKVIGETAWPDEDEYEDWQRPQSSR